MAGARNAAFERLINDAEKQIAKASAAAEKKIARRADRAVKAAETAIDRAAKRAAGAITRQLEAALRAITNNAEEVGRQFALDAQQTSRLRRSLETASGGVEGFKAVAPWANIVPDPRLRAMLYAAGVAIGAAQGAAQEDLRKELAKAMAEIEREKSDIRLLLASTERDVERARAQRRRTGVLG